MIDTYNRPPAIDERYSRAISSAHLEVIPTRCSADYLIAAGWCSDTLGVRLFRLRSEYDAVRADQQQARDNLQHGLSAVRAMELKAKAAADSATTLADWDMAAQKHAEAAQAMKEAEDTALTARALVMVHLTSLRDTAIALQAFAIGLATRQRFMCDDATVKAIAGRALDLWLDPNCPICDGRGFNGGFSTPVLLCTHCDGSGMRERWRRGFKLDKTDAGHKFGRELLSAMDRKTGAVGRSMKRYLRDGGAADQSLRPSIVAALRQSLDGLRSAQAQED